MFAKFIKVATVASLVLASPVALARNTSAEIDDGFLKTSRMPTVLERTNPAVEEDGVKVLQGKLDYMIGVYNARMLPVCPTLKDAGAYRNGRKNNCTFMAQGNYIFRMDATQLNHNPRQTFGFMEVTFFHGDEDNMNGVPRWVILSTDPLPSTWAPVTGASIDHLMGIFIDPDSIFKETPQSQHDINERNRKAMGERALQELQRLNKK